MTFRCHCEAEAGGVIASPASFFLNKEAGRGNLAVFEQRDCHVPARRLAGPRNDGLSPRDDTMETA